VAADTVVDEAAVQLEKQLSATPAVPAGGDPWEDPKWSQYKW